MIEYRHRDRDTESIEPVVPIMPREEEQAPDHFESADRPPHEKSCIAHPPPRMEYTTQYTWDLEMVEPLVPFMFSEVD